MEQPVNPVEAGRLRAYGGDPKVSFRRLRSVDEVSSAAARALSLSAPTARADEYVFTFLNPAQASWLEADADAIIRDAQGLTVLINKDAADSASLHYGTVYSWVSFQIDAGATSARIVRYVVDWLEAGDIPCQTLSSARWAHLLVDRAQLADALSSLDELARTADHAR